MLMNKSRATGLGACCREPGSQNGNPGLRFWMSWTTESRNIEAAGPYPDAAYVHVLFLNGFNLFDWAGQVFVVGHQFAELDESSHDHDAHLDGAAAVEHGREHRHAVLGEDIGRPAYPQKAPQTQHSGTLRLETTYHQPGGDPVKEQTLCPENAPPSPLSLDTLPGLAILAVLCAVLAAALPLAAQEKPGADTPAAQSRDETRLALEERVYIASKIYSLIPVFFAHWKGVPDLDLEAAYKQYLAQALATDGRREFDLATLEFVAKLHNGHTQFWDPWFADQARPKLFGARYLDGRWVATWSDHPGIKTGDVIAAIDRQPIEQFYEEHGKYFPGSSESQVRSRLFDWGFFFPRKFTVTLQDGREVQIERKRDPSANLPEKTTEGRWLDEPALAYIKIPSFDDPKFENAAIEFVRKFQKAKALIVDVRGNGGGGTPSDLTRSLMDRSHRYWMETSPANISLIRVEVGNDPGYHLDYRFQYPAEPARDTIYTGKLFILTDSNCASACEDFVMPFKDNKRAIIVGETTWGSSGLPFVQHFKNGMVFAIGTKREYFPDGSEFEGVGIKPDVEITPRAEDLHSGKDAVLEKAAELAKTTTTVR